MSEKRGRIIEVNEENRPRQFQHHFKSDDGSSSLWIWDLDINPNGPISTEEFDVEETPSEVKIDKLSEPLGNQDLPPNKRRYFNMKTQKWVAYFRARQLGII